MGCTPGTKINRAASSNKQNISNSLGVSQEIQPELCGISNTFDGTEDHHIKKLTEKMTRRKTADMGSDEAIDELGSQNPTYTANLVLRCIMTDGALELHAHYYMA